MAAQSICGRRYQVSPSTVLLPLLWACAGKRPQGKRPQGARPKLREKQQVLLPS